MSEVQKQIVTAVQWLKESDGILVAAANGFSIAEGFHILRNTPEFSRRFEDLNRKWNLLAPIQGFQPPFSESDDFPLFYQRLMKDIYYEKPESDVMRALKKITAVRPVFVMTTNGEDRFVQAGYPEQDVFYLEGRFNHTLDHQLIPEENLDQIRSPRQLESSGYPGSAHFRSRMEALQDFLRAHPRTVILELGVSANNPFLRPLILQILQILPQSRLVTYNLQAVPVNRQYSSRILQVEGSLTENLEETAALC